MRDSAGNPCSRRQLLAAAAGWAAASATNAAAEPKALPPGASPPHDPLPGPLRALVQRCGLPSAAIGLCIQPVLGRGTHVALNAEQPFQLASTAKVVTALAALDLLGPQYRWRTPAFLHGPLDAEGRLDGDLLILGGGDALLSTEHMLDWFRRMRAQGLREVRGNIVLDRIGFRLTEADLAGTPLPSPERPHHARPDALVLDEGRLRLWVQSAPRGTKPRLGLAPAVSGLHLQSELDDGPGCDFGTELQAPGPGQLASRLRVHGHWGPECGQRELQIAPWPHEVYTLRAVGALWRDAGGRLRGKVVAAPPSARQSAWPLDAQGQRLQAWSVHRSEALPQLIRDINKTSDNLAARHLMLSMAPGFPVRVATLPGARDRVQRWLRQQGLGQGDIAVDSGSGLSRGERGKPRAMVQLLRRAWSAPQREAFLASLPVAGVDGTLAHRMTRGQATGRAFLKTGTLLDTRALAGYVLGKAGTPYAVTALVNHAEAQRALPMLDGVVEWLAAEG